MLPQTDLEEIIKLFKNNQECSIVLISHHMTVYDMRISKRIAAYGIEFHCTGAIPYIISEYGFENELNNISKDYYSYKVLSTYNDPYYGSSPTYCSHEWVNVGFHWDKYVCKKCNKDKD